MQIPSAQILGSQNLSSDIRRDDIYRLGRPIPGKPRPLIVKFLTKLGKDKVFSKQNTTNLREANVNIRVAEHFVSETRERRTALIDELKILKTKFPDDKYVLARDKILANGKPVDDQLFEQNPPTRNDYNNHILLQSQTF